MITTAIAISLEAHNAPLQRLSKRTSVLKVRLHALVSGPMIQASLPARL